MHTSDFIPQKAQYRTPWIKHVSLLTKGRILAGSDFFSPNNNEQYSLSNGINGDDSEYWN